MRTALTTAAIVLLFTSLTRAQYGPLDGLTIDKPEDKEDAKPVPAPEGAMVLFNGKDVDNWTDRDGKAPSKFKVVDGVLQVNGGDSCTKEQLSGDYKLHLEFRVPYEPNNHDQGRGNSGVYLQSHWEVQVLDSYHNKTYPEGACGAIYSIEPPRENAAKAPTVWQSYDIEFHAAKCENGNQVEPPTATVIWNGVKVHDNTKLNKESTPSGKGGDACKPGPLMLQDHGHPVQYRNIWVQPIK